MRILLAIVTMMSLSAVARPPTKNVVLEWSANPASDAITQYSVYEKLTDTNKRITTLPQMPLPKYVIVSPSPGTHRYFVTAKNTWKESLPSNIVTVRLK